MDTKSTGTQTSRAKGASSHRCLGLSALKGPSWQPQAHALGCIFDALFCSDASHGIAAKVGEQTLLLDQRAQVISVALKIFDEFSRVRGVPLGLGRLDQELGVRTRVPLHDLADSGGVHDGAPDKGAWRMREGMRADRAVTVGAPFRPRKCTRNRLIALRSSRAAISPSTTKPKL